MPSRRSLLAAVGSAVLAGCGARPPLRTDAPTSEADPGTATRTGSTTRTPTADSTPRPPGETTCGTAWEGAPVASSSVPAGGAPAVGEDRLFVASKRGLAALAPDLRVAWRRPGVDGVPVAVADGTVVVRPRDGRNDVVEVAGVDARTGAVRWGFAPPGEYARVRGPAVLDGTVYVGVAQVDTPGTRVDEDDEYARLYGLDARTGERTVRTDLAGGDDGTGDAGGGDDGDRWTVHGAEPWGVVAGEGGVFLDVEDGTVAVDPDGTVRWRRSGDDWGHPAPADGGRPGTVVQPTEEGVRGLDAATGETKWREDRVLRQVTVADGVAYGADGGPEESGTLVALDAASGDRRWTATVAGCGRRPAVEAEAVAVPVGCREDRGYVGLFDADDGCRYGTYALPYGDDADTPALVAANGRLYVDPGDPEGRLLAFELPAG